MAVKEFSLEGLVAIVTGGGRGYGKAIALAFAKAGADVVVAARSAEEIAQTTEEVRQLGRKGLAIATDVTKAEQVQKMVDMTISEFSTDLMYTKVCPSSWINTTAWDMR